MFHGNLGPKRRKRELYAMEDDEIQTLQRFKRAGAKGGGAAATTSSASVTTTTIRSAAAATTPSTSITSGGTKDQSTDGTCKNEDTNTVSKGTILPILITNIPTKKYISNDTG